MIMWGLSHVHPFLMNFYKKYVTEDPPGVKFKNTARERVHEPRLGSKLRGDVNIFDEFSSQTGGQGALKRQNT